MSSKDDTTGDASPAEGADPVHRAPVSKRLLEDEATVHEGEACIICLQSDTRCLFIKFVDEDGQMRSTKCVRCDEMGLRTSLNISGARTTPRRFVFTCGFLSNLISTKSGSAPARSQAHPPLTCPGTPSSHFEPQNQSTHRSTRHFNNIDMICETGTRDQSMVCFQLTVPLLEKDFAD